MHTQQMLYIHTYINIKIVTYFPPQLFDTTYRMFDICTRYVSVASIRAKENLTINDSSDKGYFQEQLKSKLLCKYKLTCQRFYLTL